MPKFCPECANPIVENNMPFCPKCGAKLPITSSEPQPPANQPLSVQQPPQPSWYIPPSNSASTSVQTPASQSRDPTTESTTKRRSLGEWIAIICGGIILLVILSAFIAGMSVDNYKYCIDNFPGTKYDPSSKMCEKIVQQTPYLTTTPTYPPTPTPTPIGYSYDCETQRDNCYDNCPTAAAKFMVCRELCDRQYDKCRGLHI